MYKYRWYCRWCGGLYRPTEQTDRDGFCCSKHKQALYRAHKKYVTLQARAQLPAAGQGVTRKTRASQHASQGKKRKKRSQK